MIDTIHNSTFDAASGQHAARTEFMIPMRDGVRLATDVHLPAGFRPGIDTPLPTILERTPYGKREVSRSEINRGEPAAHRGDIAAYFVARGFAVVFQDCRGRHASEGEFTKYLSEGPDGYDTLEWITRQDWSTGRVGTMGLSYAAHTQMATACMNPPGLACMVMDSGGFANSYHCGIRQGGAFELKQATWAVNQAKGSQAVLNDPLLKAALDAQDLKEWFARMPWRPGQSPLRFVPEYERYLFDQWTHETFDEFWQQPGIYAEGFYDTMARVPTVLMSSWYDAYVRSTMDNFAAMSKLDPVAAPTYLIMGSWLHGDRNVPFSGDVDFGPAAMIEGQIAENWLAFRAQWFDRWLKPATPGDQSSPILLRGSS
jgi:putative CocE/NonD family hydrolase